MQPIRKVYAEFFNYKKSLLSLNPFGDPIVCEVRDRALPSLMPPENSVGVRFFDKYESSFLTDDGYTVKMSSDRVNISPMHFFGKEMTIEEIREQYPTDPEKKALAQEMERRGMDRAIITRNGMYFAIDDEHDYICTDSPRRKQGGLTQEEIDRLISEPTPTTTH